MKSVDLEAKSLLDKLYNLRSSESSIIAKMESEKNLAEETKVRTETQKENLTELISSYNKEEKLLVEEGQNLKTALENINKDSFNEIFEKLSIDFAPQSLFLSVEKELPITIERIKKEREISNQELDSIERDMNDAITLIDELSIRKDEALSNQSKLNDYISLALEGNINITRDALTNLLSKFELNEEEQREAAKLLMFPEDGLYSYEENHKENLKSGKSFSEVFAEAKEPVETVVTHEEPAVEEFKPVFVPEDIVVVPSIIEKEEEITPIVVEETPAVEEKVTVDVKKILTDLNFNILDFNTNDITFIEENIDEELLVKNVEIIKNLGVNLDIFVDNIELFIDDELEVKINTLISVGKVPFDIYLNPNVLVKYDANELRNSIESLKESGLDPKKVPLMAY